MWTALRNTIEGEWLSVVSAVAGSAPRGLGTPDLYVLAQLPDHGRVRVDVYRDSEEVACFEDARAMGSVVVVGCGARVHFADWSRGGAVTSHALGSYFGSLFELCDSLLVASAERVFRFTKQGAIIWRSDCVGIDGVILDDVDEHHIRGSGEWDPPGGWQPFLLELSTGESCVTRAQVNS
jgi:hypothetical protein